MKRKIIITILCLTMGLSIVACGKQETTSTTETIPTTVESTQTETSENTTEPTEEIKETETENENTEKSTEITDNIVYPDVNPEEVDPKTTTMDAETATALAQQERKEIDAQYGGYDAWAAYAHSQGADGTLGWCWIYYTGQGAGDQESYAVYMKEDSSRYGEVFHLGDYLPGGDFFVGANNKEHGIADDRELQRKYDNGELGDGITITENGDIIIE